MKKSQRAILTVFMGALAGLSLHAILGRFPWK